MPVVLLLLLVQTSCSWVLKESRSVYKAASEGVMNLADKFFEMERAQALQVRLAALMRLVCISYKREAAVAAATRQPSGTA